jgi:thiol-disulfide isomerase/thioredoxin
MQQTLFAAALVLAGFAAWPLAAAELKPWSGRQPVQFQLKDLSGASYRLADYRGRVVLVNFWATWCEPCRDEMPAIEKLKERFAGRPFAILAVNVDEPEARVRKFLASMPLSFTVLLDHERKLARAWNVRVLPASYVVAPDGTVRFSAEGELDWSTPEIAERLSRLFPRS